VVFTGTFEHSIDDKNRLAVPAEIRSQIRRAAGRGDASGSAGESGEPELSLFVTLGEGQSLSLYTEEAFEQRAAELDQSERDPDEILPYESVFFSLARRVEIDKQGRVRLPDNLLAMAKLSKDVVLLGVKDHLEIRDRQTWQAHVQRVLSEHPELISNPRRLMRRPRVQGDSQGS
jgi:MraZ protein